MPPGAALQIAQWLERQRRGQGPALERGHGNGVPNVAGRPLVIFAGEFAFTWNAQGQIVVYDDPQVIEGTPPNLEAAGIPAEFDAAIGDLVSGRRHQPTPEERALINGLLGFPTQELLGDYITLPGGISLRDLLGALPDDVKQDIELFQALGAVLTGTGETLLDLQELEMQGADAVDIADKIASSAMSAALIELLTLKLGQLATPAIRQLAKKFFGEGPGRNLPAQLQKEVIEEMARHGDKVTAESTEQFLKQLAQRLDDQAQPVTKEIIEEIGEAAFRAPNSAAGRGLARATEHIEEAASSIAARRCAAELAGLGDDAVPFVTDVGPQQGSVVGRQSPDGLRGWRIDWDPDKGYHVNWWDKTGGTKRKDWLYGAITITGGTWDDYIQLLKHGFGN